MNQMNVGVVVDGAPVLPIAHPFKYGVADRHRSYSLNAAAVSPASSSPSSSQHESPQSTSEENSPGLRCGHSLTALIGKSIDDDGNVIQREGAAMLVLFGGATSLEGSGNGSSAGGNVSSNGGGGLNQAQTGASTTPSQPANGGGGVRLAGATNDVHIFDIGTGCWRKIIPEGEMPTARAAHAAAAIGHMVVVVVCYTHPSDCLFEKQTVIF